MYVYIFKYSVYFTKHYWLLFQYLKNFTSDSYKALQICLRQRFNSQLQVRWYFSYLSLAGSTWYGSKEVI